MRALLSSRNRRKALMLRREMWGYLRVRVHFLFELAFRPRADNQIGKLTLTSLLPALLPLPYSPPTCMPLGGGGNGCS